MDNRRHGSPDAAFGAGPAFDRQRSGVFDISKAVRMPKRKKTHVAAKKTARPSATRKRRAADAGPAASTLPWLRSPSGSHRFELQGERAQTWSRELQHAAMQWTYIVRNRQRWRGLPSSAKSQGDRARKLLVDLGLRAADLDAIAGDGMVEVVVPYEREEVGWEARIFPWEYVACRRHERGASWTKPHRDAPADDDGARDTSTLRTARVCTSRARQASCVRTTPSRPSGPSSRRASSRRPGKRC